MPHTTRVNPTVPPRRNELGAQLARFETLCHQGLDASAKLSKLHLHCGRDLLQQNLPWVRHWLRADSPAQRSALTASQHAPDFSPLTAYLSAANAVSTEWLSAYHTWVDAALSNSGEQWLRALAAPTERLSSWSGQAMNAMSQAFPPTASGVPARAAAARHGAAGDGIAPPQRGAAKSHAVPVA